MGKGKLQNRNAVENWTSMADGATEQHLAAWLPPQTGGRRREKRKVLVESNIRRDKSRTKRTLGPGQINARTQEDTNTHEQGVGNNTVGDEEEKKKEKKKEKVKKNEKIKQKKRTPHVERRRGQGDIKGTLPQCKWTPAET